MATSSVCSGLTDSAECSADATEGLADSVTNTADGLATEAVDNPVTDSAFYSVAAAVWTASASSLESTSVLVEDMSDWRLIWALPLATLPE